MIRHGHDVTIMHRSVIFVTQASSDPLKHFSTSDLKETQLHGDRQELTANQERECEKISKW